MKSLLIRKYRLTEKHLTDPEAALVEREVLSTYADPMAVVKANQSAAMKANLTIIKVDLLETRRAAFDLDSAFAAGEVIPANA